MLRFHRRQTWIQAAARWYQRSEGKLAVLDQLWTNRDTQLLILLLMFLFNYVSKLWSVILIVSSTGHILYLLWSHVKNFSLIGIQRKWNPILQVVSCIEPFMDKIESSLATSGCNRFWNGLQKRVPNFSFGINIEIDRYEQCGTVIRPNFFFFS